jgi:O-antigen/teichoic acid export membrane protein
MNPRSLRQNVLISAVQAVVGMAVLFLVYRLVYRGAGPADLGMWSLLMAVTQAGRVADFGLGAGIPRHVAADLAAGDRVRAARCIETAATVTCGLAVLLGAGLVALFLGGAARWLPEADVPLLRRLALPAVAAFTCLSVGGVYQGALDGIRRSDLRCAAQLTGQAVLVAGTLSSVPRLGVVGFGWAMALQFLVTWLASAWLLRRAGVRAAWLPVRAQGAEFRRMLGLGVPLQMISLVTLLSDPVTKFLLARFGGAASVGTYELASRLVQQVHLLLSAAMRPVMPAVTTMSREGLAEVEAFLAAAQLRCCRVVVPAYAALAAALPVISVLWLGAYNDRFVLFAGILCAGWMANACVIPQYTVLVGLGRVRAPLLSHVYMGLVSAGGGAALGAWLGGPGPVLAWAAALISGSWGLARLGPPAEGLRTKAWLPRESRGPLAGGLLLAGGSLGIAARLGGSAVPINLVILAAMAAFFLFVERRFLLTLAARMPRPAA